jgi:hypothetical protein
MNIGKLKHLFATAVGVSALVRANAAAAQHIIELPYRLTSICDHHLGLAMRTTPGDAIQ